MTNTDNLKGLCERLTSTVDGVECGPVGNGERTSRLINPDGPEAAERLRAMEAALTAAEPMLETLHSIVTAPDVRKSVWSVIKHVRAAKHPANRGERS